MGSYETIIYRSATVFRLEAASSLAHIAGDCSYCGVRDVLEVRQLGCRIRKDGMAFVSNRWRVWRVLSDDAVWIHPRTSQVTERDGDCACGSGKRVTDGDRYPRQVT